MASMDDLPLEDRQAIADFSAFLAGTPACVVCMTPTLECDGERPCCPDCTHGRLQRVEGPPRTPSAGPPRILLARRRG